MGSAISLIDPAAARKAAADKLPVVTVHLTAPVRWAGAIVTSIDMGNIAKARRDSGGRHSRGLKGLALTIRAAAIMAERPIEFLERLGADDLGNMLVITGALLVDPNS